MSILDALAKHGMFSETLDKFNQPGSHQMKGFDFAQNFPGAVPGGINTPASFLGPMAAKGYQYSQELGRSLLDGPGGYTIGQALKNAGIQSDANIQGMAGKGFDMDTYNQNLQDFNINDVTFANSFGLDNLFNSSAMANEPVVNVDSVQSAINAVKNRQVLDRIGLLSLDDAGLTIDPYETFAQKAKPGFNLPFAKQLGSTALSIITGNPFIGLLARGLGALAGRGGLTGVKGGADLRGDTGFDTFRRSTSLKDFFQRRRDKKAREEAARRGELKELQRRIDKGDFDGRDPDDAPGGAASNQDARRGGQYG